MTEGGLTLKSFHLTGVPLALSWSTPWGRSLYFYGLNHGLGWKNPWC